MNFSDDELRQELTIHGLKDFPPDVFQEFKKHLHEFICSEKYKGNVFKDTAFEKENDISSAEVGGRSSKQNLDTNTISEQTDSTTLRLLNEFERKCRGSFDSASEEVDFEEKEKKNSECEFSDDEIRNELSKLGYKKVSIETIAQLKKVLKLYMNFMRNPNADINKMGFKEAFDMSTTHLAKCINDNSCQRDDKSLFQHDIKKSETSMLDDTEINQSESRRNINDNAVISNFEYLKEVFTYDNITNDQISMHTSAKPNTSVKDSSRKSLFSGFKRIDESITKNDFGDAVRLYSRACYDKRKPFPNMSTIAESSELQRKPSWLEKRVPPNENRPKQPNAYERMEFYKTSWAFHKYPGQNADAGEGVAKNLKKRFVIKKEQKIYVPNTYKAPHEKRRKDLRYSVKLSLAAYKLPKHGFYNSLDS